MAPDRKKKHSKSIKAPTTYVHPSLASSAGSSQSPKHDERSVSQRIEYLRKVQTPRISIQDRESQSYPAPISGPADRTRPTLRVAGPRPPRSWTDGSVSFKSGSFTRYSYERRPPKLEYFPGADWPAKTNLLHQALKALALNFEWHREFDHYYLSTLPVSHKILLLRYLACYGPDEGIDVNDFRYLLSSQSELDQLSQAGEIPSNLRSTESENLDSLDLGGSIGRALQLKQLEKYWTIKIKSTSLPPEEWDASDNDSPLGSPPSAIHSSLRFPSLVKLSLAYPGRGTSWAQLIHFSRHLGALTHLSLARWPTPRSDTTIFSAGNSLPGGSDLTTHTAEEAVDALHQLSRNTPSLVYLSLAGCEAWYRVICHTYGGGRLASNLPQRWPDADGDAPNSRQTPRASPAARDALKKRVDFNGAWRRITQLDLTQALPPPPGLSPQYLKQLHDARRAAWWHPESETAVQRDGWDPDSFAFGFSGTRTRMSSKHDDLRPSSRAVSAAAEERERYRIVAPASVAEQMRQRERARLWREADVDALDVAFLIWLRRAATPGCPKGPPIDVVHGWGKQELLDVGYAEADLFEAGF